MPLTEHDLAAAIAPQVANAGAHPGLAPGRMGASLPGGLPLDIAKAFVLTVIPGLSSLVADEEHALIDVFNGQIAIAAKDAGPFAGVVVASLTNLRDLAASHLGITVDAAPAPPQFPTR